MCIIHHVVYIVSLIVIKKTIILYNQISDYIVIHMIGI